MKKLVLTVACAALVFGPAWAVQADPLLEMQDELAWRLSLVERYHAKAARSLVTAAQDEVFRDYFTSDSDEEKKRLKAQIDEISLAVQAKYKVDEMCLIDKKGQEISRIVYRKIAPDKDLSSEEASAPFFKPSFALDGKKVHISEPYMSADSLRWVICYGTPIVLDDGSKPGIYHYEMSLYDLQEMVNRELGRGDQSRYLLLIDKNGYILSDSREKFKLEMNIEDKEMKAPMDDYFPRMAKSSIAPLSEEIVSGKEGSGSFTQGGKAYLAVYRPTGQLDWTAVLVREKDGPPSKEAE